MLLDSRQWKGVDVKVEVEVDLILQSIGSPRRETRVCRADETPSRAASGPNLTLYRSTHEG